MRKCRRQGRRPVARPLRKALGLGAWDVDPFRPVVEVLATTRLAPAPAALAGPSAFAELCLHGRGCCELRMACRAGELAWPHAVKVLLDGEVVAEDRRRVAPLALELRKASHELQVLAWDAPQGEWHAARDLLLSVVLVQSRSVADLLQECRLRSIPCPSVRDVEQQGEVCEVTCETPWSQPLRCPLTMERLKEPARGALEAPKPKVFLRPF